MESGKAFHLAQDFYTRPRHQSDESQQREYHRELNGVDRTDRDHAERRRPRKQGLGPIDLVEKSKATKIDQRQRSGDKHRAKCRERHVLQWGREEQKHERDRCSSDKPHGMCPATRCIADGGS